MRVLLSTHGPHGSHGSHGSRGDVDPMLGRAVRLRALQARGSGEVAQVIGYAGVTLDISDFPTRHPYGPTLWQARFEPILTGWVDELGVPVLRGREVTGFTQDDTGADVALSDGQSLPSLRAA